MSTFKARRMFLIKVPIAVAHNGYQLEIPGNNASWATPSAYFTSTGVGAITIVEDTGQINWVNMVHTYWAQCYVGASKMKYRFISLIAAAGATQGTIWKLATCAARTGLIGAYSNDSYEDVQTQPRARKKYTYNSAPNNKAILTHYASTKQVFGLPARADIASDPVYYGTTASSGSNIPSNSWNHYFVCQTIDESSQTNDTLLEVRMTYYCKAFQRKLSLDQ